MSSDDLTSLVEAVVAKYSLRNLRTVIIACFLAGLYAALQQFEFWKLSTSQSELKQYEQARIVQFAAWKDDVDKRLLVSFTTTDYDTAAVMFNTHGKPTLPYFFEIKREQK